MASERLHKAYTVADKLEKARNLVAEVCGELKDEDGYPPYSLERLKNSLYKIADEYRRDYLEVLATEINMEDL